MNIGTPPGLDIINMRRKEPGESLENLRSVTPVDFELIVLIHVHDVPQFWQASGGHLAIACL
jgi:hypothetical protein